MKTAWLSVYLLIIIPVFNPMKFSIKIKILILAGFRMLMIFKFRKIHHLCEKEFCKFNK